MSKNEQPKKRQRKVRATKVQLNKRKSWQTIVNEVEKNEVPVSVLKHITVLLVDGTTVDINVKHLIQAGQDPIEIEEMLDEKFASLDQYIENVDFFVDIDLVEGEVQKETDKVLKRI